MLGNRRRTIFREKKDNLILKMKESEVPAVNIRTKDQISTKELVVSSLKPSLFCLLTESKGTIEVIWRVYWDI